MKGLELTETAECPDWIAPGIWPLVKREMVLKRAGVIRDSNDQSADKFGLDHAKFAKLLMSRKWRREVEDFREQMAQKCIAAADIVADALLSDLDDPVKVAKMSPRDKTIMTKQLSENVLNLSNGMVGSPSLGSINFTDIKVLMGAPLEKP